jgi:hypothetical protein
VEMHDGDRFDLAVRPIVGKRLTYKELTGKENPQAWKLPYRKPSRGRKKGFCLQRILDF